MFLAELKLYLLYKFALLLQALANIKILCGFAAALRSLPEI